MNLETKRSFKEYDSLLTTEQYLAVTTVNGPMVVCAGAGSGKTRVIAYRVFHLIERLKIDPQLIICVTFTNKAAIEMEERIRSLLQESYLMPMVTTFHSYGLYLIRRYGEIIGINDFSVIDEDEKKSMLQKIIPSLLSIDKNITVKKLLHFFSERKNSLNSKPYLDIPVYSIAWNSYEKEKKQSRCMDFDDILTYALSLLKIESIQKEIRKRTRHLLVDEYQDTNTIQHEMVKQIAQGQDKSCVIDSLVVVGDPDQSIYSWRGALPCNITDFSDDFKETVSVSITQNYRSVESILSVANQIILNNKRRNPKELWSTKLGKNSVVFISYENGFQEGTYTAQAIRTIFSSGENKSVAILYRAHYQSRLFEEACVSFAIPYKIIGNISFYERQEIKDILSYAIVAVNGKQRIAFLRSCNTPTRGLGEAFQEEFIDFWDSNNQSDDIFFVIDDYIEKKNPQKRILNGLLEYKSIIEKIRSINSDASEVIESIIKGTNYFAYIEKHAETPDELQNRKEHILELKESAKIFTAKNGGGLHEFVDHVSLMNFEEPSEREELRRQSVFLMTLHAAKGLEFDIVFLVGVEEKIIPSSRAIFDQNLIEEECRLLYVGVTRAKSHLFCSYSKMRTIWGNTQMQIPSRFIEDILQSSNQEILVVKAEKMPGYVFEKHIQEIIDY